MAKLRQQKADKGLTGTEVGKRNKCKEAQRNFLGVTGMFYDLRVVVSGLYICQNSLNCVKNYESYEILPYLLAKKLAC